MLSRKQAFSRDIPGSAGFIVHLKIRLVDYDGKIFISLYGEVQ